MAMDYNRDEFDLSNDFTERTNTSLGPDEFVTVEEIDVEEGESITLGVGASSNPLQAEGSASGDIQDDGNADIDGRFRFVVLNSQNNVVRSIAQGPISTIEKTRANSVDGYILPYTNVEVAEPYKIGFQLRTGSGTATYSSPNSSLEVDGYRGESMS
jgi:hypothetical protein